MSMLSMGIKMLFMGTRYAAKKVAKETGVGEVKAPIPNWTLAHKIEDLNTAQGVSMDYLKELISGCKSSTMLHSIESYLVSPRNTLGWKTTDQLLEKVEKKLGDAKWQEHLETLKEQFLANHHDITTSLLDHVKELI